MAPAASPQGGGRVPVRSGEAGRCVSRRRVQPPLQGVSGRCASHHKPSSSKNGGLMKYPPIKGQIFVQFSSNEGRPEVYLDGDPAGLRSLAALCVALAEVDQAKIKELPEMFAREHVHLVPGIHLGKNSASLCVGRAEDKRGELDPTHEPRPSKAAKITSKKVWIES